jgi:hypothetical protein
MRYVIFFILLIASASCVKDDFCIEPNAVALTMNFKTYDSTGRLVNKVLEETNVYNTDTALYFAVDTVSFTSVTVAPDRRVNNQTYVIEQLLDIDTVQIFYSTVESFISNGCGYQTYFDITKVLHSTNGIDSVNIIEASVNNTAQNPHLEVIYK